MCGCSYHAVLVEVRGQLAQIDCLLLLLGIELRSAGFCGKNFYLLSHFTDYCSKVLQVKDGNGEIFPCHEELGELLLSEMVCVCGHVSSASLSVDGESEKLWEHPYQWRSQSWNMPLPAAPGSDSDSASSVL